ncbi:unnamed protein product, partial [Effrenium voratum]
YKFLQELDDPKAETQHADLESSLDGVAEKWLGWAVGGRPAQAPAAATSGGFDDVLDEAQDSPHAESEGRGETRDTEGRGALVEAEEREAGRLSWRPGWNLETALGRKAFLWDGFCRIRRKRDWTAIDQPSALDVVGADTEATLAEVEAIDKVDVGETEAEESQGMNGEETSEPEPMEPPPAGPERVEAAESAELEPAELAEPVEPAVWQTEAPAEGDLADLDADAEIAEVSEESPSSPSSPFPHSALPNVQPELAPSSDMAEGMEGAESAESAEGAEGAESTEGAEGEEGVEGVEGAGGTDGAQSTVAEAPIKERGDAKESCSPHSPAAEAELRRVAGELAEAQGHLKQRERQLADLSNALAEMEARETTRLEQAQALRGKAGEVVKKAEEKAQQFLKRAEQAEQKAEELKERAAIEVRRLKQEARDMEQELLKAQETWRERIKRAEARASDLEKEGKEAAAATGTELAKLRARLRAQASGSEEARSELEAYKARAEEELGRVNERLRASGDSELRLRQELQSSEHSRQELQERVVELSGQLEHAQQAYSEAAREVGTMSLRLNELEFSQRADSHSEDLLRQELSSARERLAALEERHKECVWMRDHALQQAEEAVVVLRNEQLTRVILFGHPDSSNTGLPWNFLPLGFIRPELPLNGASTSFVRVTSWYGHAFTQQQLQKILEQHQEELQQQATRAGVEMFFLSEKPVAISKEEIDYLKRKNDEKDKRLEILTCERNALRYESSEASVKPSKVAPVSIEADKEKLVDLEDGTRMDREGSGAVKAFCLDGDLVLKRFSKQLGSAWRVQTARVPCYGT